VFEEFVGSRGYLDLPARTLEEVSHPLLLQAYTYLGVGIANVRSRVHDRFVEVIRSESGATAAEYALLVSLIAIAIILGATHLGNSINTRLDDTATTVGS
jgi:pilus assembly protein Flp/PilA